MSTKTIMTHLSSKYADEFYLLGDWVVCFDTCTVKKEHPAGQDSIEMKVTPRSMEVLKYLCDRPGEVVSVTELISEVWARSTCTDHLVHKAIAELRNALSDKPASPNYIKTVPKRGYIIIADVQKPHSGSSKRTAQAENPVDTIGFNSIRFASENGSRRNLQAVDSKLEINNIRSFQLLSERIRFFPQNYKKLSTWGVAMCLLVLVFAAKLSLVFIKSESDRIGNDGIRLLVSPFFSEGVSQHGLDLADGVRFSLFYRLSKIRGVEVLIEESNIAFNSDTAFRIDSSATQSGPTHVLRGSVSYSEEISRVYVQIVEMESGLQQYAGQFDVDTESRYTSQDEIADNIVSVLRHQLNGADPKSMEDIGTVNIAAYERYQSAMFYYSQFNPDDFRRAINLFKEAIRLDPDFVNAYYAIAVAANNLSARGRSSTIEEMYQLIDDVHRDLLRRGAKKDILNSVNAIKLRIRGFDYAKNEEFLRELILSGEPGNFAVPHYALMLISAKMYDEADRLLVQSKHSIDSELTPDEVWSYRSNIMTPGKLLSARKTQLLDHPHNVSILSSVVVNLSFLNRHEEADLYLSKLRVLDTEGILYHRSKIMYDYFSGAFEGDIHAIEDSLINDPDYFYNNGLLCFMLGNIDQGIAYWDAIPALQRRQVFLDLHRSEKFFPPHIVISERYQRQVELLGNGRDLQRRLIEGLQQMSSVTGIELNSRSYSAYQENAPMVRNNLWTDAQWTEFYELRDNQINSNAVSNLDLNY